MTKMKPVALILCILLIAVSLVLLISESLAYFRFIFDKSGTNTVMVELIFDHLDFNDSDVINAGFADEENGNEIPWGSEKNPYVISQKYHIQNLSVLQNSGFFASRVKKDENGDPILDENNNTIPDQSYFLVCNTDGTPVSIDCDGIKIAPIGSHEYPFTGVIRGAPIAGSTTYNGYGSSVSTIADLTVESNLDEPDIGFFGRLGYNGTYDAETLTVSDGFAAIVDNLLFADVTISSRKSFFDTLEEWWNLFLNHLNRSEEIKETHHVGIIAGHAEFATVSNISVYYTENVPAFDLVSNYEGSNTNYYSTTGLIGLLECVNPEVDEENGTLSGSAGIRDSDLLGDGSAGGGGDESGTLTGYFLAENLFSRHEEYLHNEEVNLPTADAYDVKEMKINEKEGGEFKSLFSSVQMSEGFLGSNKVTYYYFNDTVFTFTMSSSSEDSASDSKKTDYVMKLWKLEDERPFIYGTDSQEKWQYADDLGATPRISYKLTALESQNAFATSGYYVMLYVHEGDIYVVDMQSPATGYMTKLDPGQIYEGDDDIKLETLYFDDGSLKEINVISTGKEFFSNAFYYASSSIKMRNPNSTLADHQFGFTVPYTNGNYTAAKPYHGNATNDGLGSYLSNATSYFYDLTFTYHQNGKFSAYIQSKSMGPIWNRTYVSAIFKFDAASGSLSVQSDIKSNSNQLASIDSMRDETCYFTIMKLTPNTVDEHNNITNLASGNYELTPKNIVPTTKTEKDSTTQEDVEVPDTLYSFDPSTHVLEYINSTNSYRLAPIRSYKLNNGKGDLLEELNHTVKLYKATTGNFSLQFGGNFPIYSDGGVLRVPIGTTGMDATLPAGMIAFHILKASVDDPSYINVIVAVNPEQKSPATVGLWKADESFWGSTFDLTDPDQSFVLPVSMVAESSADSQFILPITERVVGENIDGKIEYTTVAKDGANEVSYVYLGGEHAFIYYSFEVTEPDTTYLLGSAAGSLSISYFSVSGAAGEGNDGMSGSPLGSVDFVYSFEGQIITTDKLFAEDEQLLSDENYSQYYPSYLFVSMLPEENKIQNEVVKIRRYVNEGDTKGTRRHLMLTGQNETYVRSVSVFLQDLQDDID